MFGSANPFAKSASSGGSFSSTGSTFGKRISKEDSGNEEDVPPKRSFSAGVNNPFANLGKSASNAAFPSSKPSTSSFGTGAAPAGGGFSFKPGGVFGSDSKKENSSSEQKASFAFRPTSVFGANESIATDTSSFVEDAPVTNTSSLGGSLFGAPPPAPGAFSSSLGMNTTEKSDKHNPFAVKTSFPATSLQGKSEISKASVFQLKSSFGGSQESSKPAFVAFSVTDKNKDIQPAANKFDPLNSSSILIVKDIDSQVCSSKESMNSYVKNVLQPAGLEKAAAVPAKKSLKLFFRDTQTAVDARTNLESQFPSLKIRFGRNKEKESSDQSESTASDPFTTTAQVSFDLFGSSTSSVYTKQINEQKKRHMEKTSEEELQPLKITRTSDLRSNSPFSIPDALTSDSDHRVKGNIFGKKSKNSEINIDSHVTSFAQKTKNRSSPEPSGFASFLKSNKSKSEGNKKMQTASLAHDPDAIDIDLAEKRFKILETRDKVVRDVLIQELREGAQVGICADLCPEKEIYRRWTQQDISVLEFNSNGQIDIEKCVKVYQRSAADTEESLPNELRPASTLLDCCWYFCSEVCTEEVIANVGADVWYDFMWKRTRAIRKDITQQHMSCLATAQVLETVARYHIWCSHSMVLEEFWEQRINDENLEKTLTSIEHVYQDISVRGQYSPAEPEFRAYMIYLNLNDSGAVMKYLSCVPKRFKMHPLIKRARRIVSAYMLRHYAIFWNEFSKCTALEASILHRYMENVRYQAMQILRRGYANNVLPLKCFQRALFFKENDPNFETYMAAHNVYPNDEGEVSIVEMAKSYVAEPDEALPKWKSKYIMEELTADRTPGQLIWGSYSSLKPWATKNYKPSSSFLPRSTTLVESAKDIIDNVRAKLEENAQVRNQSPQEDVAAREIEEEITNDVVVGQLREIASSCKIEGKIIAKQAMDNMSLILDNHIGWEIKRIYKNMLLRDRLMKEEEKNRIAEEKERAQEKRERWTSEFLNDCFSELRDSTTDGFLLHFVETSVDEQILKRNDEICTETAHIVSENLLENVISRSVRMFMTEEVSETKRLFQQKVAAVRQKRRDRISKQAARWWIRRTRIAISKRKARAIKPNIGTRNILKEISQRNEEFMKMTIDRAKRSWKSEKKHSHSYSIIYSDKEVSPFNVQDLLKNTNPKLSGFVSSFVFYADEHDVYEYLQKKFPDLGVIGSKSKYIYLELSKIEPNDGIVFDEEVFFGTSSKSDIMIDFSDEEETNRNIELHLTDILLSTKPRNFTREPLVKIFEHVIIDSENGIRSMDGLVKGYSHVRIHQKPSIILTWYNNLIDQMIRRMSIDGLELNYPPGLVNTGLVYGPTITQTHISLLKSLKLPLFNETGNKYDPESCLNAVAKYLDENGLSTIALKVQITRVVNRKVNDDLLENESIFPWSQVISKIIESKLMRLHFKKEAREQVTVEDRLFRRFDALPLVRKEIKRIERRSPKIPKRYKFQKPRELENLSKDNSFMDESWPRPVSVDLDKAIDLDDTGPSFDNSQQDEFNNAVTIETLFKGIEAKFENEISKSKQTFVDAKGTIDTLKKDFERFQEMETLRAMVKSKPRPRDLTFMEHEKEILQAELDTKLTEIDLMVALSKKRRDEIKQEYENMEPEEVNFDPSDMIDLDEPNNEPIDFEPSDISDVFSKGPTDLNEIYSPSDCHQSDHYAGESRDSSQFKPISRNTVGMAVSDDESSAAPGRIYDNPLTSGPKKRLHDDESRMALSESDCESQQGKQMDQACDFVPSERLPMIDEQAVINVDDDEIIGVSSHPCEANTRSLVLAPDTQDIKNPSQESLRSFVSDRSHISETQNLIGSQSQTDAVFAEDINDYELMEDDLPRLDEIENDEKRLEASRLLGINSDQESEDDSQERQVYHAESDYEESQKERQLKASRRLGIHSNQEESQDISDRSFISETQSLSGSQSQNADEKRLEASRLLGICSDQESEDESQDRNHQVYHAESDDEESQEKRRLKASRLLGIHSDQEESQDISDRSVISETQSQEKNDDESQNDNYSAYDSDGNRKHVFVDFEIPDSQVSQGSDREQKDGNASAEYISSQNTSNGSVEFVSQTQAVPETQFSSGDDDEQFVIPETQFSNDGNAPVFIEDSSNDSAANLQNAASLENVNERYVNEHVNQFDDNEDFDGDYGGFPLDEDDEDNMPLGYVFGQRSEDCHYGRPLNNAEFENWESGDGAEAHMIVHEDNEEFFHDEHHRYSESEESEGEGVQYEVPCNRQHVSTRRPRPPQNDDDEVICLDSD